MTDDFISIVKAEYNSWREREKARISKENQKIKVEIEIWNKIHRLLQAEKVREFARYIGYEEGKVYNYLTLHDSLCDFLRKYMTNIEWPENILKYDKYPIYCFYRSETSIYSVVSGKRMCGFDDLYWNLQRPGYSFGPSDSKVNGKNREIFRIKNTNSIIYPPESESFANLETFYRIQTEFVEESLRTNQGEAKKLMLQKYGRKQ